MTGPTCVWSVSEALLRLTKTPLFQFRAQFWAQLADFGLFRPTRYLFNVLIYRELAWLRGRDLNPRPLGYENKVAQFKLVLAEIVKIR